VRAVIVNYRRPDLTGRAVASVLDSARAAGVPVEVVVVDNSAGEAGHAAGADLAAHPGAVRVLANRENAGFARACNQGAAGPGWTHLLLLNSDAVLGRADLRTGLAYLAGDPRAGLWAPRLVGSGGAVQASCARLPSLATEAAHYLTGRVAAWYRDAGAWDSPTAVGSVTAACWLLPRTTWQRVGPLDEAFFFNGEDVDYCRRVAAAGLRVVYDPRCTVLHLGGASQPWTWRGDPHLHRNRVRYFRKHHGRLSAAVLAGVIGVGLGLRGLRDRLGRAPDGRPAQRLRQ
jgi:GT2 family glycosyltransferase